MLIVDVLKPKYDSCDPGMCYMLSWARVTSFKFYFEHEWLFDKQCNAISQLPWPAERIDEIEQRYDFFYISL